MAKIIISKLSITFNINMMKKIILTLLLAITFTATYSQSKHQERQNKYFVEAATKEYNLNKLQQDELKVIRTAMVVAYGEATKQEKSGDITSADKISKTQEASKNFNNALIKLTGIQYDELEPFLTRMRAELKQVK
ncbi:hypothetical protein [Gelidibacter salicanalis]|uniref:Uncharacterized protein n=1 Tax=Gelidibacter salicanalis TaxID=291193 RepID=A0A934KVS4_9FLAO|nr:hypothetical protein [Gelidibacter salicanalis]MBJ7881532.1 hypothetical protein [Gelidibacter salicanalis]